MKHQKKNKFQKNSGNIIDLFIPTYSLNIHVCDCMWYMNVGLYVVHCYVILVYITVYLLL